MITGIVSLQLMQFFMNVGSVSGTFGMMKKIAQIMDTDSEPDGGEPVPEVCADIEFDNVSFAYAGGQDVIKNLSVKIPMGKVTAVIGGNGARTSPTVLTARSATRSWRRPPAEPTSPAVRGSASPLRAPC